MLKRRTAICLSLGIFLGTLALVAATTVCRAQAPQDSKDVTNILDEVKSEAIRLRDDADSLNSFTHSSLSWESHSTKVGEIREHVNNIGQSLGKLDSARTSASPWQQQAIDSVTRLARDLAANVESTIYHLNQRPQLLQTGPYADYAAANYDLASQITVLVSDYVEYGKSKAKSEELAEKLEVPGT